MTEFIKPLATQAAFARKFLTFFRKGWALAQPYGVSKGSGFSR
jgi:hypothetical protein